MSTKLNREISDRFYGSGLSRKEFALSEGMSGATLAYHLKRAGDNNDQVGAFRELELPSPMGHIEIRVPSGTVVRIPL